jgi:DNA-binding HxlR family transcriptional regulator
MNHIFILDAESGKLLRQKKLQKEMVGMMRFVNGSYYYWCSDQMLYKTSRDLKQDKLIYKNTSPSTEFTGTYMVAD